MANVTSSPPATNIVLAALRRWWQSARTSYFWMIVVALTLRWGLILIGHTYKFRITDNNFGFGWEMGRIGRSLASGQGFSNPFDGATGPTAWEPPLYPLLIAGVFKLFGIYTHASALVLLTINSLLSALTCIPIFLIAKRCFSEVVAVWTAWLWVVLPFVMYWCTRFVWETSLAALLLTMIFWLALVLEEKNGWIPWLQFGLLWAIAALTNVALLSFLPASGLWIWTRRWKRRKPSLAGVAVASLVFLACIVPWQIRNYRTFGKFLFIRSNFGAELRLGNGPGANGTWMQDLHPSRNLHELQHYQQMGEIGYVAARRREAMNFIRQDYARFAVLCVKRFIFYWAGTPRLAKIPALTPFTNPVFLASSLLAFWGLARALHKRQPGAALFLWLVICYPAVYYFVFSLPRYRHPMEPELLILIVYVISDMRRQPALDRA